MMIPSNIEELDPFDRPFPLHVASNKGDIEHVKALVSANPGTCFERDNHGRTPAHVAAMKGHVDVLEELLRTLPSVSRQRVGPGGDNIMHVCVKYNQLEVLKSLARMDVVDAHMLLNAVDEDGNTILHVAVADKQIEIIRFLLNDSRVEKNKPNSNGLTAKDTFLHSNNSDNHLELRSILEEAKLLTSHDIKKEKQNDRNILSLNWVETQLNPLMVVASLLAAMAFQAGLSPPGGTWEDDRSLIIPESPPKPAMHRAGWAILAETNAKRYKLFVTLNTVALVSSMSSMLLLISGLRKGRFFTAVIMMKMWMAISAMTCNYWLTVLSMAPKEAVVEVYDVLYMSMAIWASVMGKLLLRHANAPWTRSLLEKLSRRAKKLWRCCFGKPTNLPC